jgi:hypothetical protein
MHPDTLVRVAAFLVAFAAMYAAHMVADHWVQTQHQADEKGKAGWHGRWNCAKHVATYTLTQAVAFLAAAWWLDLPVRPGWLVTGLLVSAVTHYFADRRTPLRKLAERIGSGKFYRLADFGLNGAYLLDQSWHVGWIFIAALVVAGP